MKTTDCSAGDGDKDKWKNRTWYYKPSSMNERCNGWHVQWWCENDDEYP